MTRSRIAAALLAVGLPLIVAAPASAANKEQQQMLADIRMLQEQAQLMQNMLASLGVSLGSVGDGVKAVGPRIDEQTAALSWLLRDIQSRHGIASTQIIQAADLGIGENMPSWDALA